MKNNKFERVSPATGGPNRGKDRAAQHSPFNRGNRDLKKKNRPGFPGEKKTVANSQNSAPVPMPEGMVFYCKTCEQIVDFKPTTFNFKYPIDGCAKGKADVSEEKRGEMMCDLAYGTERSIKHFYKIKDDKFDKERREREEKAARADKL